MPTKSEVIENLNWTTERLSNRVWTICVGVLATSLAYIVESAKPGGTAFLEPRAVVGPASLAMLALLCDLAQYYTANRQSLQLLRQMEESGATSATYSRKDRHYAIRNVLYQTKILLAVVSAIWLIVVSAWRVVELL